MRRFLAGGLVTLSLGIVLPAFSAEESVDQRFAAHAAMDSMAEIELGQLALDKSNDPKVREFANRMIQDHSKANMQLESIAKSAHVVLPAEPGEKLQMPMNKLSGLSDKAFDRAYAKAMVEDHEEAVKLFQQYQRESSNKELGAFAQQTLPILEKHLHMAQTLEKSLGGK
jgi:putative membrane protein